MARVVPRVHNLILDKITPTPSTPSQSITKTPSTAVKTAVQKKLHSLIKHLKEKLEPATAYIRRLAAFAQKPIPMLTTQDILQWMIVLNNPQYSAEFGIRPAQARQQRRYLAAVRLNAVAMPLVDMDMIHRLDRDLAIPAQQQERKQAPIITPARMVEAIKKSPPEMKLPLTMAWTLFARAADIQNLWPEHVTIQQQQANIQMKMSKSGKKNPFRIDLYPSINLTQSQVAELAHLIAQAKQRGTTIFPQFNATAVRHLFRNLLGTDAKVPTAHSIKRSVTSAIIREATASNVDLKPLPYALRHAVQTRIADTTVGYADPPSRHKLFATTGAQVLIDLAGKMIEQQGLPRHSRHARPES